MQQREFVEYPSAMQAAFLKSANASSGPLRTKVARVADRVRVHREPAINAKLSYRTAQKLRQQGAIS